MAALDRVVTTCFNYCCILCGIYLLIALLVACQLYDIPQKDPQIVFAYISLIHLIILPLHYYHLLDKKHTILLVANFLWIVCKVIAVLIFSVGPDPATKNRNWRRDPLSHVLVIVYLTCGVLLQVFILIRDNTRETKHTHTTSTASVVTGTSPSPKVSQVVRQEQGSPAAVYSTTANVPVRVPSLTSPQLVTYPQAEPMIVTETVPARPHRKKHHQSTVLLPVTSTGGNTVIRVPSTTLVRTPSP